MITFRDWYVWYSGYKNIWNVWDTYILNFECYPNMMDKIKKTSAVKEYFQVTCNHIHLLEK